MTSSYMLLKLTSVDDRPTVSPLFLLMRFMPFFAHLGPAWLRRKLVESLPAKRIRKSIEISDSLERTVKEIVLSKKTALAAGDDAVTAQIGEGKDILSVLSTHPHNFMSLFLYMIFTGASLQ